MSDEDFQQQVLGHLAAFGQRFDAMDQRFDAMDHRLDAVVSRLDEQDVAMDRLTAKVDRLSQNVSAALSAAEQAITGLTSLSRRVSRLEGPAE